MSNAAHFLRPPINRRPNRAERRRRARSRRKGIHLKGPVSYQVELFKIGDIFDGALVGKLFGPDALALHSAQVLSAANGLADRMQNTSKPTTLCCFCDHSFAYNEPPAEILVALPFANADHPAITSPVCAECASGNWADKQARVVSRFREILGPDIWVANQAGTA